MLSCYLVTYLVTLFSFEHKPYLGSECFQQVRVETSSVGEVFSGVQGSQLKGNLQGCVTWGQKNPPRPSPRSVLLKNVSVCNTIYSIKMDSEHSVVLIQPLGIE